MWEAYHDAIGRSVTDFTVADGKKRRCKSSPHNYFDHTAIVVVMVVSAF